MENSFFYCERTSLYFFSEPLNIITNFCFIFTSFLLLKDKSIKNKFFPIIIFFIGIGSLLLHSIPSSLTAFLDVFFIVLFIVYYLYNFYNFLNIKKYISISLSILFIYLWHLFGNYFSSSFLSSSSYYFTIVIHLYLIMYVRRYIFICIAIYICAYERVIFMYIYLCICVMSVCTSHMCLFIYVCMRAQIRSIKKRAKRNGVKAK